MSDWLDQLDDEETEAKETASAPDEASKQPKPPAAEAEASKAQPSESGADATQPTEDDQPVNRGQLAALLAEREKRQQLAQELEAARKERERVERELSELRATHSRTPEKIPDPLDDAQAYQQWTMSEAQKAALSAKLELSEDLVRQDIGDDKFEEIKAWWISTTKQQPHLVSEGLKQRNPWRFAVQQFKRAQVLSEVGDDPSAYEARIRERVLAELQASQGAAQSEASKVTPPPSLAKGGSGGASQSIADLSEDEFFASTFKR